MNSVPMVPYFIYLEQVDENKNVEETYKTVTVKQTCQLGYFIGVGKGV